MKRLSTKLDELEQRTGAAGMLSPAEKNLLVQILAKRDALFWPWRVSATTSPPMPEIRLRQREYFSGVCGIAAKGSGAQADWKTAHELRRALIGSRMLTAVSSGGQVTSVFLTGQGEATARALVGDRLATFHAAGVFVLARLRDLSAQTPVKAVRESLLWNGDCVGSPNAWDHMTELILPCLTAGLVSADSDTQGRACFTPVDGIAEPPEISVDVRAEDGMDAIYLRAFESERAVLASLEQRDVANVYTPLPATGWGWPCHFPEGALT